MRAFLIGCMSLGLMAGFVGTAEASHKPKPKPTRVERTVEARYGPYPAPVTGCNSALGKFACAIITTRPTEAFFTAKVTDAHGQPVFVQVEFWCGGYGTSVGYQCSQDAHFCGETRKPIRFPSGAKLAFYVGVNNGWPQTTCPAHSIKTTGTISVTLSNMRS